MTLRIAALASGTGSNVASIMRCIDEGLLDAHMAVVISNKPGAPVLEKARDRGIPTWARSHKEFETREAFDEAVLSAIREHTADTVVLAGYMRMLSPQFVRSCPGPIVNIHPAILPSFPGLHGGPDALAYGVKLAGPTVHFVDEIMDNGPVIIQGALPVSLEDTEETLMPRIHALEHRIYPQALQWLAEGRLQVEGRRVRLLPSTKQQNPVFCGNDALGPWMVSPGLEGF